MIRSTTLLMEALQEEVFLRKPLKEGELELLLPSNSTEILIPIDCEIELSKIGSPRVYRLLKNEVCLLAPRARGINISADQAGAYVLITEDPFVKSNFIRMVKPIGIGVYKIEADREENEKMINSLKAEKTSACLDQILLRSLERNSYNDTIIESIELIRAANGLLTVKDIYEALGISKSKLEHHFKKDIGLTPKEYCRIEKLKHFLKCRRNSPELSLTELTYIGGYYDQSHLIKEFKYFTGTSPKRFLDANVLT